MIERKIKPGRAVFTVVGLARVYKPGPVVITKAEFAEAVKFEPQIYEIIDQFLDGKREGAPLPKYDHDEIEEIIEREINPDDADENLAQFRNHPEGEEFAAVAGAAREYLRTQIPRRLRTLPAFGRKPEPPKPSTAERLIFRRHVATVEKPLWALKNLLAGTLVRDHLDALEVVWPDVLEVARLAAENGIADRVDKNPDWAMPRRIARQLAVLKGEPIAPPDFVRDLQAQFAKEQQIASESQRNAGPPPKDEKLETIVQRVADGRR